MDSFHKCPSLKWEGHFLIMGSGHVLKVWSSDPGCSLRIVAGFYCGGVAGGTCHLNLLSLPNWGSSILQTTSVTSSVLSSCGKRYCYLSKRGSKWWGGVHDCNPGMVSPSSYYIPLSAPSSHAYFTPTTSPLLLQYSDRLHGSSQT